MNDSGNSIAKGCSYFGKSRPGYYGRQHSETRRRQFYEAVLKEVKRIRQILPRCGTRKLQYMLREEDIIIGRDALFGVLREEKMLIRGKRKHSVTTDSRLTVVSYKNLLKDFMSTRA